MAIGDLQVDVDARVDLAEAGDERGQDVGTGGGTGGHGDVAAAQALYLGQGVLRLPHQVEDAGGVLAEDLSTLGQVELAPHLLDEADAQCLLQLSDLHAYRRLADIQLLSGPGKALVCGVGV